MNVYLDNLTKQRDELVISRDKIVNGAVADGRDMTDAEDATCADIQRSIDALDAKIEPVRERELRDATHAKKQAELDIVSRAATPLVGQVIERGDASQIWRSPGAYILDYVKAFGPDRDRDASARIERAVAHQLLADNPGVVPTPIVGPVVTNTTYRRPTIDSSTRRPMPQYGSKFERPVIAQHTQVDKQTAEKTDLASRKLTLNPLEVAKETYGGALNISFQNRDWTDPAILDIVVSDLGGQYALQTNKAHATTFLAAVKQKVEYTIDDTKNFAAMQALLPAVYQASAMVAAAVNDGPDTVWAAPDVWGVLGGALGPIGPMFPSLSPANANGGNGLGLRLVVDNALPAGTFVIGNSNYLEFFEQEGGMVSVTEPTILGYTIAWYGYIASCVTNANAFVLVAPKASGGGGSK